jgi:uncharacterized protein (TIGR03437 family)
MNCQALTPLFCFLFALTASAQEPTDLINRPIDNRLTVTLPFSVHPKARREDDAGVVPANLALKRMKLLLHRSPAQQAALDQLLAAQQDPQSPEYHHWLTPDEFGSRFGFSQNDLNKVSGWLRQNGFTVDEIPKGRWMVVFSGTAALVQAAFHTELHYYNVGGTQHRANSDPLQIPAVLAPVVDGVLGIHDFQPKPVMSRAEKPKLGSNGTYFLSPSDFAAIYDLNPLYSAGISGAGQGIAIAGVCAIDPTVVQTFRTLMGLPPTSVSVTIVPAAPPVPCPEGALVEPYLDVEWAGAVARNASINLVAAGDLGDALVYMVDNNVASVTSTSFEGCEPDNLGASNRFLLNLWQQASTHGITSLVSSGDSGAAGCDSPSAGQAGAGLAVNAICSTPYNVCVGGTEFAEGSGFNLYWSSQGNVLSYIPEMAWNESQLGDSLFASGGGYSVVYAKSTVPWQTGNSTGFRGVPDVSLTAANHDGYFVCVDNGCNTSSYLYAFGTSAASPAFAGIMAMVVQATGKAQGNVGSVLYKMAAATSFTAFHDTTTGNNSVPGQTGYTAGPGWDPVTGLGSVDAAVLVNNWPGVTPATEIGLNPAALSFANENVGVSSSAQSVTITAAGANPVRVSSIGINGTNGGDFSQTNNCTSAAISPGSGCTVMITFKPTATGSRTASLLVVSNTVAGLQTLQLSGTSVAQTISRLSPSTVSAGGPGFTLTVTGAGFLQGMVAQWNGSALTTTFVSAAQLTATVPASLIATQGTATVTVVSSIGSPSNALTFVVSAPLAITSLTPSSVTAGAAGFTLTVIGTAFTSNAVVLWNGTALVTTFVSSLTLQAAVPANLVAIAGKASVTVLLPGGAASGAATFTINPNPNGPSIATNGIVPLDSSTPVIQTGSWVSIYGNNLATAPLNWNNDFPTSLGGVSVTVNSQPAYLSYVSPTLINMMVPDAAANGLPASGGPVTVVVTNSLGGASAQVTLAPIAPSFILFDATHAAGVIPVSNGTGAYGGGTYDFLGPAGLFPFNTRPVKVGEYMLLYGVGFGPTSPHVPSGQAFSGAAPTVNPVMIVIGGVTANVQFSGIVSAGLYQFNVLVPNVPSGDQPLSATVNGIPAQSSVVLTVQ